MQGGTLVKQGSGTLTLTGVNNYSGGTTITAGTLQLENAGNLILAPAPTFSGPIFTAAPGPCGTLGSTTVDGVISGNVRLGGVTFNQGGATATGTFSVNNAYSGGTTLDAGTLQFGNGDLMVREVYAESSSPMLGLSVGRCAAPTSTTLIPAGPVFYIITEGAGLGDSVHSVPCTGKETVLDAVGHVNGISQVSLSTKIWIARPSPTSHDKSTVLPVDWEAISKRGINTTNYKLLPGDRLVFGEDPLITRSNLLGRKTAVIERILGITGLTTATLRGLSTMSAADVEVLKELVRKGIFTDDQELKQLMLDMIHLGGQANTKAGSKEAAEQKASQGEEKSNTAGPQAAVEEKPDQGGKGSNTASPKATVERKPDQGEGANAAGEALPHELALRPLPDYRIEPPDVIQIEMPKPVPLQSAKVAGTQPVSGQYLVGPDGTVNLRQYGRACVMGMTLAEARLAIQKQLAAYLQAPEPTVDVVAYNSKVYYIITQGAGLGDNVRRLPITGKETVLDAVSQVNGLSQISSKNIWIARPSASDAKKERILSVDWDGITGHAATATNYQIFPGDRLYIGQDPLVTQSNLCSKKTAIIERLNGVVGLTTSTLCGLKSMSAADVRGIEGTRAERHLYRRRGDEGDLAGSDRPPRSGPRESPVERSGEEAEAVILKRETSFAEFGCRLAR